MSEYTLWCLIEQDTTPFPVYIMPTLSIDKLKCEIKRETSPSLEKFDASDLILWKLDVNYEDPAIKESIDEGQFRPPPLPPPNDKPLGVMKTISAVWSEQPCAKHLSVFVKLPDRLKILQMPPRKHKLDEGEEDTISKRQRFSGAQEDDVARARLALAPSSAAAMPAFRTGQLKRPVLNGRPHSCFGLPVGLFHPVFNSFRATMTSTKHVSTDAQIYSSVRALFSAFANIYVSKSDRIEVIDRHLGSLLGSNFIVVEGAGGVKSDGVIIANCGPMSAYLAIREVKNEIGTGSADPYNQGSLAYRKYWAAKSQDIIREHSCCPSIILAIAGPWLCVLGAVYLEKAVIQPLTDYVWLGGDQFDRNRLESGERLMAALKSAYSDLRSYYEELGRTLSSRAPEPPFSGEFPYITEYGSKRFRYLSRLAKEYEYSTKLLWQAKLEDDDHLVVVKFVSDYNAEAHRILATHQLAPALHYAGTEDPNGSMYGGRYMIVMDFVDGKPGAEPLSERQFRRIEQAIQILHSHDLVFGDLRGSNILVTGVETSMIIDFDWCGRAGEAQYPADLNPADELNWPSGVTPRAVMMKEHDLHMLKNLRPQGSTEEVQNI